jgi:hypothetical protein
MGKGVKPPVTRANSGPSLVASARVVSGTIDKSRKKHPNKSARSPRNRPSNQAEAFPAGTAAAVEHVVAHPLADMPHEELVCVRDLDLPTRQLHYAEWARRAHENAALGRGNRPISRITMEEFLRVQDMHFPSGGRAPRTTLATSAVQR